MAGSRVSRGPLPARRSWSRVSRSCSPGTVSWSPRGKRRVREVARSGSLEPHADLPVDRERGQGGRALVVDRARVREDGDVRVDAEEQNADRHEPSDARLEVEAAGVGDGGRDEDAPDANLRAYRNDTDLEAV